MRLVHLGCASWTDKSPTTSIGLLTVLGIWAFAVEARGQAPPAANLDLPVASTPIKTAKTVDLANRYRFVEHYPREDGRELAGSQGPYRVGLIEVIKDVIDQPQGAPRRSEITRQSVYIERATEQAGVGGVIGSVRFIERYLTKPEDPARMMGLQPLAGLTVAGRFRSGDWPLIASLTDRKPTDYEYEVITRQMVVPQLLLILPGQAIRTGDSWRIPRRGAQAILGDPKANGDGLVGKFNELRKEVDGPRLVAVFGVTGRITTSIGESAVNAEVFFTFQPEAPAKSPLESSSALNPSGRTSEGLIEARGAITEVRMARTTSGPLAGPGRLRFQSTREVTMQRQINLDNLPSALPKLPAASKTSGPESALTWVDPSKRFQFDHPQDLLPLERPLLAPLEPGSTALARSRREVRDLIQFDFVAKTLGPDDLKAKLAAKYAQMKLKVIQGEEGWLPEVDWPNQKVYRIEAAVQVPNGGDEPSSRSTRIHFDGYLVQTAQAASFLVIATTSGEPVAPFRREVEQILKTILLDPSVASTEK